MLGSSTLNASTILYVFSSASVYEWDVEIDTK